LEVGDGTQRVEDNYDLVIIDTPPSLNGLTRSAWAASDRVLLVTEPGIFAVGGVKRAMQAVDEIHDLVNHRLALAGIVLNRFNASFTEHDFRQQELTGIVGAALAPITLPERAAVQQAQGAARPIHSWPGEAAVEISESFDSLLAHIQENLKDTARKNKRGRTGRKAAANEVKQGFFRRRKKAE